MVKAIFFDFWGTIVENGVFPSPVRQAKQILNQYRLPFPLYIIQFERALMTKKYADLYEAFTHVCNEFKVKPTQYMLDKLVGMWNKNKLLSKPFPETIEVLEKLKGKYKLVLISNTDCFSVESVMDKFKLKDYFDVIVLSYEVGMLKSDPKMFDIALKKLKLKKEDVIMVGDSVESDIAGANKAEIKGILIDRQDRREFEDKILSLTEIDKYL